MHEESWVIMGNKMAARSRFGWFSPFLSAYFVEINNDSEDEGLEGTLLVLNTQKPKIYSSEMFLVAENCR